MRYEFPIGTAAGLGHEASISTHNVSPIKNHGLSHDTNSEIPNNHLLLILTATISGNFTNAMGNHILKDSFEEVCHAHYWNGKQLCRIISNTFNGCPLMLLSAMILEGWSSVAFVQEKFPRTLLSDQNKDWDHDYAINWQ